VRARRRQCRSCRSTRTTNVLAALRYLVSRLEARKAEQANYAWTREEYFRRFGFDEGH